MFFFENVRLAFGALITNKMRSLLTMLGIIIGISSVITITTIGNSLKKTMNGVFNMIASNVIYVNYWTNQDEDGNYYSFRDLTDDDFITKPMIEKLNETYPGKYLLLEDEYLGDGKIRTEKGQQLGVGITGASAGYIQSQLQMTKIIAGRTLNDVDSKLKKHAILISDVFVEQYFQDDEDPLGKTLSVTLTENGITADFTIVGVYEYPKAFEKLEGMNTGLMDRVTYMFVPYGTVLKLKGMSETNSRYPNFVLSDPTQSADEAVSELQAFLREQFPPNAKVTPVIQTDDTTVKMFNMILTIVTLTISVIAGISLLVGGIGVMNIMLVSITERTREIGTRKAIGAKSSTIRTQFIIEAVFLCLIGGVIGVVLGVISGIGIGIIGKAVLNEMYPQYAALINITIAPSMLAILISLAFSMLIGVFFGSYPASKAAKLNPIDALRYE